MNNDTIRLGFHRLVWGDEPIFHAKELSDILGLKNPRTIYKLLKGEQKITIEQYVIVARESAVRGDYALLELAVPDGIVLEQIEESETDGSLDDEIVEGVQCMGFARNFFNSGKYRQARIHVTATKKEIRNMDKELRLKGY